MMPNPGVPAYYGNPYGVAIGGYDPSPRSLGMLAAGLYGATMLKNKGTTQKLIGLAGLALAYYGGMEVLDSKSAPAVSGLMDEFQAASTTHKAIMVGGLGALIYYSGLLKKMGGTKRKNGSRKRRRNISRRQRPRTKSKRARTLRARAGRKAGGGRKVRARRKMGRALRARR